MFEEGSEQDDDYAEGANFSRMPHTMEEFDDIRKQITFLIFGDKPDIMLEKINIFAKNLETMREILTERHFPSFIISILYYIIYIGIMILNVLRESIMWWIVAIVLMFSLFFLSGALASLGLCGYRGYKIYAKRFPDDGSEEKKEEDKKKENVPSKPKPEEEKK